MLLIVKYFLTMQHLETLYNDSQLNDTTLELAECNKDHLHNQL